MIILNSAILNTYYEDDKQYVKVSLLADSKPDTLPTTGENIKGLNSNNYLAPGTTILTKNGDFAILGTDGWGDYL